MSGSTKQTGIYKITNIVNGKFYIGSAASKCGIKCRWREHFRVLRKNKHHSSLLQNAWNKYGEENFLFEIIEIVEDKTKIIEREQYYLDLYKCYDRTIGYNICKTAGSTLGIYKTIETRKKISDSLKGKRKSIPKTKEEREKISKSKMNKKRDGNTIFKMSNYLKNNPISKNRKIYQKDLNNNIIKTWDSINEAANYYNISPSTIIFVCKNINKTGAGYKWEYVTSEDEKNTKVAKFDSSYNILEIYESKSKAAKENNISRYKLWKLSEDIFLPINEFFFKKINKK